MLSIDLNCDLGEGMPNDAELMPFISSANIACGGHAGDTDTMQQIVELALKYNVAIGAHPSYPDKENFGRKDLIDLSLRPEELIDIISEQVNQLKTICYRSGTSLKHIKPHGALYNRAARDKQVSTFICRAILQMDPKLVLYGLSGSEMKTAADEYNIKFVSEVFADRTYQDDGSLTARSHPNALIENEDQALAQVIQMIKTGTVQSLNGNTIPISAETICLHGDGKNAVAFARIINEKLKKDKIMIRPVPLK
jgi:UPF0271 protein